MLKKLKYSTTPSVYLSSSQPMLSSLIFRTNYSYTYIMPTLWASIRETYTWCITCTICNTKNAVLPHNNYVIFLSKKIQNKNCINNNNNKCWKINKRKRENNNNWWKLPLRLKEIWTKKKKKYRTSWIFLESFVANSSITGARICFSCERLVHWFRRRRLILERPEALNIHGT